MVEFTPTGMAHGGAAVGRIDGKAHFVDGAMPGELVRGEVVHDKGTWARVTLQEVVQESPHRVTPPCPHFADCGGCQWQFADYPAQLEWKQSIVTGQLAHIGGLDDPPVGPTLAPGPEYGYRNRMDFSVLDGAPALTQRRTSTLVAVPECLLLHPNLGVVFERLDDLDGVRGLTLRASTTTGEVLAVVRGPVPDGATAWGCAVSRRDRTGVHAVIGRGDIHETVGGMDLRVTGDAFFQNNTAGAEALVTLIREALEPQQGETLLDAYAGGGLFAVTVGSKAGTVVAVEANGLAVYDLRHNLAEAGVDHQVEKGSVDEVDIGGSWDIAIVDPPREGLRRPGVAAVTAGRPRSIAYVSCDPASLARDSRHLDEAGYRLDLATPVDLFPQTFHIETVARFTRK
ncbi:MAG: class I SAM-dependent RNA methyltransferase [Acidimicrobiia bacterium]